MDRYFKCMLGKEIIMIGLDEISIKQRAKALSNIHQNFEVFEIDELEYDDIYDNMRFGYAGYAIN